MLPPATVRKIIKELTQLKNSPPEDIRVQVDEEDVLQFIGIIAGPEGTPYHGGYFRVRFTFGSDFPNSPPKCILLTRIFHPNVSASGDICVNTLKKDWKPTYGITHILTVIRCLLIYPNPESALDEEAGKMLLDDYEGYCKRARMMTSVHAARGGKPVEFQDQKKAEPEDSLAASLLDAPGPSGTLNSTRTTIANPSSTTSVPTQPTETATTTSKRPAADKPQVPSSTPINSETMIPSANLALGVTAAAPLRASAQSNGAPPHKPSPAPNEKDSITIIKKESMKNRDAHKLVGAIGVGKTLKRPASAVSGGVKENGNGMEKRKKGLKRL